MSKAPRPLLAHEKLQQQLKALLDEHNATCPPEALDKFRNDVLDVGPAEALRLVMAKCAFPEETNSGDEERRMRNEGMKAACVEVGCGSLVGLQTSVNIGDAPLRLYDFLTRCWDHSKDESNSKPVRSGFGKSQLLRELHPRSVSHFFDDYLKTDQAGANDLQAKFVRAFSDLMDHPDCEAVDSEFFPVFEEV